MFLHTETIPRWLLAHKNLPRGHRTSSLNAMESYQNTLQYIILKREDANNQIIFLIKPHSNHGTLSQLLQYAHDKLYIFFNLCLIKTIYSVLFSDSTDDLLAYLLKLALVQCYRILNGTCANFKYYQLCKIF